MKNCPYCHNPIYDSAKRCMFCGRNLDFELAKKLERQRAAREQRTKMVKAALLVFSIMVSVTVITIWTAIYSPVGAKAKIAATQTAVAINYCNPDKVRTAANQLIDFNNRWADIMALAVSVDRDTMVLQVDRLQRIRRDAREVYAPDCMMSAKASLVEGMDTHINGLLAYMKEAPLEEVNRSLTTGNLEINAFLDEVERLQACAPDCR